MCYSEFDFMYYRLFLCHPSYRVVNDDLVFPLACRISCFRKLRKSYRNSDKNIYKVLLNPFSIDFVS